MRCAAWVLGGLDEHCCRGGGGGVVVIIVVVEAANDQCCCNSLGTRICAAERSAGALVERGLECGCESGSGSELKSESESKPKLL